MTRRAIVLLVAILVLAAFASVRAQVQSTTSIILATTTSTQDSGLLDVLVPRFEKESGIAVKVIAVGSGAALRMASKGDADVVLVHAPAAELPYVKAGELVDGRGVMHNDFVIVGPSEDPAGIRTMTSVDDVMHALAARAAFVSRGDDSGTHSQELALWAAARIDPGSLDRREETGQGMGATLTVADQRRAYTLTDRGTYLSLRRRLRLAILFRRRKPPQRISRLRRQPGEEPARQARRSALVHQLPGVPSDSADDRCVQA